MDLKLFKTMNKKKINTRTCDVKTTQNRSKFHSHQKHLVPFTSANANYLFLLQFCSLKHVKRCLKKKKGGEGNLNSNCLELKLTSFTCSSSHTTNICSRFHSNTVYTQWRAACDHQSRQVGPHCHAQGRAATNTNWPLHREGCGPW